MDLACLSNLLGNFFPADKLVLVSGVCTFLFSYMGKGSKTPNVNIIIAYCPINPPPPPQKGYGRSTYGGTSYYPPNMFI